MKLGLTGGIASGKSTVAAMLVERGALLVDADLIAREVVEPGSPVLEEIATHFAQHFQTDVLAENRALDRKKLGALIFSNHDAKLALESLIHPPIRARILERVNELEAKHPESLVVADIPLLFESKYDYMFPEVMLVYVPREVQIARLMERDGISLEHAEQRLAAQMPMNEKRALADVVIDNSGDLHTTERQIEQYWRRIQTP